MPDMMEYYISLWVGCSESSEKLLEYVSYDYETDEDSQFMKDFQIDYLDEDFTERVFLDKKTDSIKYLLSGCSYEDKVIPEFEKMLKNIPNEKFDSGILVYDMKYNGNITVSENKYCWLKFVGTIKIEL